jgi:predicted signal transduction protein with EAL and GGDEF domain
MLGFLPPTPPETSPTMNFVIDPIRSLSSGELARANILSPRSSDAIDIRPAHPYESVLDTLDVPTALLDHAGEVTAANHLWVAFRWSQPLRDAILDALDRCQRRGGLRVQRDVQVDADGRDWVAVVVRGGMTGFAVSLEDATERRAMEKRLMRAETTDPATGLLTAVEFAKRISTEERLTQRFAAVLRIEVRSPATTQHLLGSEESEDLLFAVARRLRATTGEHDVLGRLGPSQLGVLTSHVTDGRLLSRLAHRFANDLSRPIVTSRGEIDPLVIVGAAAACLSPVTDVANCLLQRAEDALREAVANDRDLVLFDARLAEKLDAVDELRNAAFRSMRRPPLVEHDRRKPGGSPNAAHSFGIQADPIVDFERALIAVRRYPTLTKGSSSRAVCVEELELVMQSGPLPDWMGWLLGGIDTATVDASVPVQLPVVRSQLLDAQFVSKSVGACERHGRPVTDVTFELDERLCIGLDRATKGRIQTLARLGGKFNLTNASGSARLFEELPLNEVTIAPELVSQICDNCALQQRVRGIAHIAESFGLSVLAAGVKTESEWSVLQALGIVGGTGPLFALIR